MTWMQAAFLLKPVAYVAVLWIAARLIGAPDGTSPRPLRLGLFALARTAAGLVVGPLVFLGVSQLVGQSASAGLVALGLAGSGLWFVTGRIAFRGAPSTALVVFAIAAEAVSLSLDYAMSTLTHFKFC